VFSYLENISSYYLHPAADGHLKGKSEVRSEEAKAHQGL
jgi:hypothetical protein